MRPTAISYQLSGISRQASAVRHQPSGSGRYDPGVSGWNDSPGGAEPGSGTTGNITRGSLDGWLDSSGVVLDDAFAAFDQQDSGSTSYGLEIGTHRWFVKIATTPSAQESFLTAIRFHDAIDHPAIVRPVMADVEAAVLVFPWLDGEVLNRATVGGSDRSALSKFRRRPVPEILRAVTDVLDAHRVIEADGFVAVDFYDGSLFYDFEAERMHLIDLDEYRPGPFTVPGDRMPGSRTFMAPEEWHHGSPIDWRTTVFGLGRAIDHLLRSDDGDWREPAGTLEIVEKATRGEPAGRHQSVDALNEAWLAMTAVPS
jgi:serine/threonine-protein kinase